MTPDTAVEAERKSITFLSKYPDLEVILKPAMRQREAQIMGTTATRGERVKFQNYVARVTPSQADRLRKLHLDEFGEPNPEYGGSRYGEHFWEKGDAPGQLKPSIQEQTEAITRAAVKGDAEAINAVLEAEEATHKREEVFAAGRAALEAMAEEAG